MSGATNDNAFVALYRNRIGEPRNEDEVWGYWVFVVGVVFGLAGILLFSSGGSASGARRWGAALAAGGLLFLVAGPIYRLPLRVMATRLVYLGTVLSLAAIAWFFTAFPEQWALNLSGTSGSIILLYTAGLAVIALGGVVVPMGTVRATDEETESLRAELARKDDRIAELDSRVEELTGERDDATEAAATGEAAAAERAAELEALRASDARFELFEDAGDKHRWRLRHRNGNIVATSGQGYTRRHNAQKGLQSVKRNALGAAVVRAPEVESADDDAGEPIAEAPTQAPAEPPEPGETELHVDPDSQAAFEVYEDQGGEFRWRLVHENGNVLADSGEGYTREREAHDAVDRVRDYTGPAEYLRIDPTAFEIYRDRGGEFRWRLVHENGNVLGDGGEGYASRWNARRAVEGVVAAASGERDADFEVYEDNRGEHRWRLRHANGNIVADSGEGYSSRSAVDDAVERFETYAPDADVLDIGRAAFEVYEDNSEQWRWRLRHRNGNILADGGQGYGSRSEAQDAVDSVKRNAPGAETDA